MEKLLALLVTLTYMYLYGLSMTCKISFIILVGNLFNAKECL